MDLATTYLDALGEAAADRVDRAALAEELRALCDAACEAAPGIQALEVELVRWLAVRAKGGELPPLDRASDIAIAFASARGDARAIESLDGMLVASVARAVSRIDSSEAFADLVAQELRTRLLVGERPRIAAYSGRGPLSAWLRTSAARIALNLRRGAAERGHDILSSSIQAIASEPEVALLRARYREDFEAALRVALARLPSKQRAILSLSVRDGLSCDKLATLYRVSRTAAHRLLAGAREMLLAGTERELRGRLGLTTGEFRSIARVVHEDLDVSVVRLLKSGA